MASNGTTPHTCPSPMKATSNGVFQGDNPLDFALPLAILQICVVIVVTRVLAYMLKPLRQPRVIAEIIGGVLLGPSAIGRNQDFLHALFPPKSITLLDTLANIGLVFFMFLAGLEIELHSLRRTGKKALGIAIAGISLPFALGIVSSFVLLETIAKGVNTTSFLIFMGVALSITAFPVLARILAELKLLTTDVGRTAMSAAAVNDVAAWILLALAIALSGDNLTPAVSVWVFLSGCGFVIFSSLIVPPVFKWLSQCCHEGQPIDEIYVCGTLAAVLAAGFVTDTIGIHAMFGAFVIGVLVPKEGPFAGALVEKVEDLVSGLFLPLYFVSSGLKTNVATIEGIQSWGLLVLVIFTACFGKIVGTFLVSLLFKMPKSEALTLGFLMNTKGLVELIVLNIGKDRKVLNDQTFAIMVLMALFTTFITTPLVVAVYKPSKTASSDSYKHRTIERRNPNTQLRILACFYSSRNIPSMINLLESSRGTEKQDGLLVYALHLMELSERSSAILMVHKARRNGLPFWNKGIRSDANQVVVAFEAFQQLSRVSVRPMTSISSFSDMHEDICTTAERKRAAVIILPFHKHQKYDGSFETTRADFQWVNKRVVEQAPCSVGIFVDRGLGGSSQVAASNVSYQITVLFFGGGDDREALAYGARLAEHPGIRMTVVCFSPKHEPTGEITVDMDTTSPGIQISDDGKALADLKQRTSRDDSVKFEEKTVCNKEEITAVIRGHSRCNMFLVGRMPDGELALALALNQMSEYPELGPIGSCLVSPDFPMVASVLVLQQHNNQTSPNSRPEGGGEELAASDAL
ncbi:cation/H(+) antiporter 18-like [Ipomoea triloba]|uniref:cation/H(+) antiporter 18-like n=1 Tax=Ipomoea triloba TaxID=35885 RepID=UPI00125E9CFC|nr:cation/H(+) antiporter 18-like [Ipomoea triloba]XP_031123804.1 cation/H(+) antiporter 18-like [Ipomoea triloba]XP_031123805.1 cation/H(+) antiporter 18-like [Ipomoea triloba]